MMMMTLNILHFAWTFC